MKKLLSLSFACISVIACASEKKYPALSSEKAEVTREFLTFVTELKKSALRYAKIKLEEKYGTEGSEATRALDVHEDYSLKVLRANAAAARGMNAIIDHMQAQPYTEPEILKLYEDSKNKEGAFGEAPCSRELLDQLIKQAN